MVKPSLLSAVWSPLKSRLHERAGERNVFSYVFWFFPVVAFFLYLNEFASSVVFA